MTPAARVSAAIDLLDKILSGGQVDRTLAAWGRQNRYAGSKDRAAIADIIYDVLRRKRSFTALGGGENGRALLLGYLRESGQDPEAVFGAGTYAPPSLTQAERDAGHPPLADDGASADFPAWLWPDLCASLGSQTDAVAAVMRDRAPVHLRVNLAKQARADAIAELSSIGVVAEPHPLSPSALSVVEGARKLRNAAAYLEGRMELQDASSQAVSDMVPLAADERCLDFCAGGGGKTLAVAGRVNGKFFAHDVDPGRMKDLPARASRAGTKVTALTLGDIQQAKPFNTVLVDAPCSGSGSWRRDPQGKWLLTKERLRDLVQLQSDILAQVVPYVTPGGHLVYATCSLLNAENNEQVAAILAGHADFTLIAERMFTPLDGGDGFYCAVIRRMPPGAEAQPVENGG